MITSSLISIKNVNKRAYYSLQNDFITSRQIHKQIPCIFHIEISQIIEIFIRNRLRHVSGLLLGTEIKISIIHWKWRKMRVTYAIEGPSIKEPRSSSSNLVVNSDFLDPILPTTPDKSWHQIWTFRNGRRLLILQEQLGKRRARLISC